MYVRNHFIYVRDIFKESRVLASAKSRRCFLPLKGGHAKAGQCAKMPTTVCTQETFATFEVSPTKRSHHNLRFFTNNFASKGMSLNWVTTATTKAFLLDVGIDTLPNFEA